MKDVFVIGGPNGAGKSTAANRILPTSLGLRHFLNADEIARGISPFDPDSAAIAAGRPEWRRRVLHNAWRTEVTEFPTVTRRAYAICGITFCRLRTLPSSTTIQKAGEYSSRKSILIPR